MSSFQMPVNPKILGQGGFGVVYEFLVDGKKRAVKRTQLIERNSKRDGELFLKDLDHPNVIKLFHFESDDNFRYYILELCVTSMDKLFTKDGQPTYIGPMPPIMDVLLQLANGLEYIHSRNLTHRDLKPQNALVWVGSEENGTPQVLMKWADFGLSKSVNERGTHSVSGIKGTEMWCAPEIIKMSDDDTKESSENERQKRGTNKSDVFSEGLVFGYFLLKGIHPFGSDELKIEFNIRENKATKLKDIKSKSVRDLLKSMLANQPEDRINSSKTVEKLLKLKAKFSKKGETVRRLLRNSEENFNFKKIKGLLQENIDVVNSTDQQKLTPLLLLLSNNNRNNSLLKIVKQLIECGANVNHVDRRGRNALHYLCKNYRKDDIIDITKLFIGQKIDVNCIDNDSRTALSFLPSDQSSSTDAICKVRELLICHEEKEVRKTKTNSVPMFSPSCDNDDKENVEENRWSSVDNASSPSKKIKWTE